jgi:hypothetical protein
MITQHVQSFIDNAYNFFPKGIDETDPRYSLSTEHFRFLNELKKKAAYHDKFLRFLGEFDCTCNQSKSIDLTFRVISDPCVAASFTKHKEIRSEHLVLYISLIIPYFVLYQRVVFAYQSAPYNRPEDIGFTDSIQPDFVQEESVINNLLKIYFPEHARMESNVYMARVPDIVSEGNGRLTTSTILNESFEMDIFKCYFSNNYL